MDFRNVKINLLITTPDGVSYELILSELKGDVISFTTEKDIDNACGMFSLQLVARDNLQFSYTNFKNVISVNNRLTAYDIFKPMSLIDIYIDDQEEMLGIVDNCSRSSSISSDGKPQRVFSITGRDLGSILIDHKIWYDKNTEANSRGNWVVSQPYQFIPHVVGHQKIGEIITIIYNNWFNTVLSRSITGKISYFKFSDGGDITDKLTCNDKMPGTGVSLFNYLDDYQLAFAPWNYEGNIMQFLRVFAATPFNELYVETGGSLITLRGKNAPLPYINMPLIPKMCHVIFRPSPFDDPIACPHPSIAGKQMCSIHDLPTNIITDEDIVSKDLGIGRNNISSSYIVYPMSSIIQSSFGQYFSLPLYDEQALKAYGHNPMEVQIESLDLNQVSDPSLGLWKQNAMKYQAKLMYWFGNNDKYLTGTFTIKGNKNIRVGTKLIYQRTPDGKIEEPFEEGYYYVKGIKHEYMFGRSFTSTVTVSRGTSLKLIQQGEYAKLFARIRY